MRNFFCVFCVLFSLSQARAQDGFILTQWGRWTAEQGAQAVDQAHRVGARHVSVLIMLCQERPDSSSLVWCDAKEGESLKESYQGKRLQGLLVRIRQNKMGLGLIPFLLVGDLSPRAYIKPKDKDAWFRDYADKMEELAELGSELGASELLAASELTSMFPYANQWREVISRIRAHYKGHVTITTVIPTYVTITFWDALDSIGISAYFPLTVKENLTSPAILDAGWATHKAHILEFAKRWGKPLTFAEVGYPSTNVAALMPWDYQWPKRTQDLGLQQRCFEAFRRAFGKDKALRRFQIWGLSVQPDHERKAFMPLGKPAEAVVARLFTDRATLKKHR